MTGMEARCRSHMTSPFASDARVLAASFAGSAFGRTVNLMKQKGKG